MLSIGEHRAVSVKYGDDDGDCGGSSAVAMAVLSDYSCVFARGCRRRDRNDPKRTKSDGPGSIGRGEGHRGTSGVAGAAGSFGRGGSRAGKLRDAEGRTARLANERAHGEPRSS